MKRNNRFTRVAVAWFVALALPPILQARIIYVDDNGKAKGNGETWGQAYADLQAALDVAQSGDEIRVAGGTYRPSKREFVTASRCYATFALIKGVAVRGGFAGLGGADPNVCDSVRFESILSGDLQADDANGLNESDNSFHVVEGDDTDSTAILEGFTITGGTGEGSNGSYMSGGGLSINQGSPTIVRCTFRRNRADQGGALWTYKGGGTFTDCVFVDNWADYAGGAVASDASHPTFVGCVFWGNAVRQIGSSGGGALFSQKQSDVNCVGCRFMANLSNWGGAIRNQAGSMTITNCLLAGNRTYMRDNVTVIDRPAMPGTAGAIYNTDAATLTLTSCTLAHNASDQYAGIRSSDDGSTCMLFNCVLWGNIAKNTWESKPTVLLSQVKGSNMVVRYCCIQGYEEGSAWIGTINVDPAFSRPRRWAYADDPNKDVSTADLVGPWIEGDYHLQSQAGRWDPNSESWVLDTVTSPCIDAGDPDSPVGDEPEPNGGRINMGAYGGTPEASQSYSRPASGPMIAIREK